MDGGIRLAQVAEDSERQADLEIRGLRVLRFENDEVLNETGLVLDRIAAHLTPSPSPTSERGAQRT